jgi:hypothetical protein
LNVINVITVNITVIVTVIITVIIAVIITPQHWGIPS